MNTNSHKLIGSYLCERFLSHEPQLHLRAFLIGCIQPDKNPLTYFKGSINSQLFRGHNWQNAKRYIHRLCHKLKNKSSRNLCFYYQLGKLIHYTADAFTYPHNLHFTQSLREHRTYEKALDTHLAYVIKEASFSIDTQVEDLIECLHKYRIAYMAKASGIQNDAAFSILACTTIMHYMHIQVCKNPKAFKKCMNNTCKICNTVLQ